MKKRPRVTKQVAVTQHQTVPVVATLALNLTKDRDLRAAYVKALRLKGWTLESIADSLGLTRERIRQIQLTASPANIVYVLSNPGEFPVPELETKEIEVTAEPE
jgi:predicted transcriptional regulator